MPKMDGFKLTALIRAQQFPLIEKLNRMKNKSAEKAKEVCKIIAVTANYEYTLEYLQSLGFDDLYTKPMTTKSLKRIFADCFLS